MNSEMPPATYIDTEADLRHLTNRLKQESLIAVDTESNNLYAYQGQVCLIQLSTRSEDYIIDPLAITNLQPFGEILADKRIQKIFHAAEYDLICLRRDFDFEICNLFDTMYAARLCHIEKFGLRDVLQLFLDVDIDKQHQLDDWGARPLPEDSLLYAQMDTHYLPMLRDILIQKLQEFGRIEESQEVFQDVLRIEARDPGFDPDGYWKLGIPNSLSRREMAILRELYLMRDSLAREEDLPPFKIISNGALVSIAECRPQSLNDLSNVRRLSGRQVRVYAEEILAAVERGLSAKVPSPPHRDMPDPVIADRYTVLHQWRKELAIQRGLDSSLVLSKHTLWDLAHRMPKDKMALTDIEGIGTWRLHQYGDDLLKVIDSIR